MSTTIWKYQIPCDDRFTIQMPIQSKILCVQMQYNEPVIWAIVNTEYDLIFREFRISATGQPNINLDDMEYIGTFQIAGTVWHLFVEEDSNAQNISDR